MARLPDVVGLVPLPFFKPPSPVDGAVLPLAPHATAVQPGLCCTCAGVDQLAAAQWKWQQQACRTGLVSSIL